MKKLQVRQVRSGVGFPEDQRRTLRGLRLGRPGRRAQLDDTPAVRGMLFKVRHLVEVEE
jgi:large subunit ribosomal protein L30